MPTFAGLLQADLPENSDGISILPTLLDKEGQQKRDYFYFEFQELGGRQAVIKDNWKLLHLDIHKGGIYELYNLASDPSENHNLIDLYPQKTAELKEIMKGARTDDPNWSLF